MSRLVAYAGKEESDLWNPDLSREVDPEKRARDQARIDAEIRQRERKTVMGRLWALVEDLPPRRRLLIAEFLLARCRHEVS